MDELIPYVDWRRVEAGEQDVQCSCGETYSTQVAMTYSIDPYQVGKHILVARKACVRCGAATRVRLVAHPDE